MLLIKAEIKKWKRSRILIGILILTVILNLFAIERAFSISREVLSWIVLETYIV